MRLARDTALYRVTRAVASAIFARFLRLLGASWRVEISGVNPLGSSAPVVVCAWHRCLFVALVVLRDRQFTIPVSRSRDGDWIDGVLRRMGFAESARGSSSKGASTLLRALVRVVNAGGSVGMLPDGPRGPAGVAQPGVVALARMTGADLVPAGISAAPCWRFGSWDRAILPKPFARVRIHFGEPLRLPKRSDAEAIEAARAKLQAELHRLDLTLDTELKNPAQ